MVRTYRPAVGRRNYRNYTDEALEAALNEIANNKCTVKQASAKFKIPYGTLYNKFRGKHTRPAGGQTVLSFKEEETIIKSILQCSDWGYPLSLLDLRNFTKSYLDKLGRTMPKFKNNLPGIDWAKSLLKRHKSSACERLATNISRKRSQVGAAEIKTFYTNLKVTLDEIPPENIFNYDETNMSDDPGKTRNIFRRGTKYPEKVVNHSKSSTTVMFCASASGVLLPPYIVFKAEHLWNTWTTGGPKGIPCCKERCCSRGTFYNRTSHGWMDSSCFNDWFCSAFLPHAKNLPGQKVIIGDNLASHFNIDVISLCREHNISFVCLPPNSTHILQPLDVSFFRPLKMAWRSILLEWKLQNTRMATLPKEHFPSLLKKCLEKMDGVLPQSSNKLGDKSSSAIMRNVQNGFEATGIYPLNEQKVMTKILPNSEDPDENFVNNSLTEFLKEVRFQKKSVTRPSTRKKLSVEPGKSVTECQTSSSESESETISDNSSTENEMDTSKASSSHSSDVNVPESEHNKCIDSPKPGTSKDGTDNQTEKLATNLKEGDFVLLKIKSSRNNYYKYVAVVERCNKDEVHVTGFKSVAKSHNIFQKKKSDKFYASTSDLIEILPTPSVIRKGKLLLYEFEAAVDVHEK